MAVIARDKSRGRATSFEQRPVKRTGARAKTGNRHTGFNWRDEWTAVRAALPLLLKIAVVCVAFVLCVTAYRVVTSARIFDLQHLDVQGTRRASDERLTRKIKTALSQANVWQVDVRELSRQLESEPFVRSAVVSRVLPSGLRVRIAEREPVAVVRTEDGRLMWADEDGVVLAAVTPHDATPDFFMRGWDESPDKQAREDNRQRVAVYRRLLDDWRQAGIAARVSEVNLSDVQDVRAQLAGRDARVEVRLGDANFERRMTEALAKLDEETRRGERVRLLNALDDKRLIVAYEEHGSRLLANKNEAGRVTTNERKN